MSPPPTSTTSGPPAVRSVPLNAVRSPDPKALVFPAASVPPAMLVPPVYVFFPFRICVPVPSTPPNIKTATRPPAPSWIVPLNVAVPVSTRRFRMPFRPVLCTTLPAAPVSERTSTGKPPRSSVAPEFTVIFGELAKAKSPPARKVPAFTITSVTPASTKSLPRVSVPVPTLTKAPLPSNLP